MKTLFVFSLAAFLSLASNASAAEKRPSQSGVRLLGDGQQTFPPSEGFEPVTTPKEELGTQSTRPCVCVHYSLCRAQQQADDGVVVITSGQCAETGVVDVCCEPENIISNSSSPGGKTDTGMSPTLIPDPASSPDDNGDTLPSPPPPLREAEAKECGQRKALGSRIRILGGPEGLAQFGEFPWMVGLVQDAEQAPFCGGVLVSPQVVLTAAHCVKNKSAAGMTVRAGEWDLGSTDEPLTHENRPVEKIILHPLFNPKNGFNDVAILILSVPVQADDHIGFICLPEHDQVFNSLRCYATGWGAVEPGRNVKMQSVLKKEEFPIVDNSQCQELLRKTRLGLYFILDTSFICAGGERNRDTCKGDGGSPLVCPMSRDASRYFHAGIVSWGVDCGQENVPSAYSNVAGFRKWIDSELTKLDIDISAYQII